MEYIWDHCHAKSPSTITTAEGLCDTMLQSLKDCTIDKTDKRSLIIQGPAGCGKTNWAKLNCDKPALFVSHLDRLKDLKPDYHKSIIFDDLDFKHLPRTSQIHLVDRENPRDIHIRYRVAHIPSGIQKIFTSNEEPFIRDDAIKRRTKWMIINPLNNPFI